MPGYWSWLWHCKQALLISQCLCHAIPKSHSNSYWWISVAGQSGVHAQMSFHFLSRNSCQLSVLSTHEVHSGNETTRAEIIFLWKHSKLVASIQSPDESVLMSRWRVFEILQLRFHRIHQKKNNKLVLVECFHILWKILWYILSQHTKVYHMFTLMLLSIAAESDASSSF